MNISFITRAAAATKLALKAHAPTLMVAGGVVAMGAGAITGAKQTLKVEEVLSNHVPNLEKIEQGEKLSLANYTKDDARGDRIKVYVAAGFDLVKLYAVPGILFVGGAGMVFGGHRMMLQRNATLAIGFTALQRAFDQYRSRVTENFGSETDQAMLNGWAKKEVYDPVSGGTETVNTRDWDADEIDPYNRIFQQGESDEWRPDTDMNRMFLHHQRKFAQEKLNRQGYLYLSDVYESLGFQETPISRVVGWKVKRNPDGSRDIPHVDFGLDKPHPNDWIYNQEHAFYLDFNCQGLIVGGHLQKLLEKA